MLQAFARRSFSSFHFPIFAIFPLLIIVISFGARGFEVRAQTSASPNFGTSVNYSVGAEPFALAAADFNRDGKTDLITANSNNLSLLAGTGGGAFGAAINFGVGLAPQSVAAGDFNGDGRLDLAAARINSDTLSILLGNGAGGFAAPSSFRINTEPFAIATGDFNGDGKTDLATANFNSDSVSISLGNGAGGFAAAASIAAGDAPDSIKIADFNGDGRLDLATANFNSDNVSVLLGNGAGGFSAATSVGAGDAPGDITSGDFNGDGKTDLATANVLSDNLTILLGNGAGGFAAASIAAGDAPFALTAGDLNGDGRIDLAATASDTPTTISGATVLVGSVSVLYGNGRGGFGAPVKFAAGSSPGSVVSADFNGDGRLDLATDIDSSRISVLLNNAAATTECAFLIDRTSQQTPAEGGDTLVTLTTAPNCSWSAVSNSSWVTIKTAGSGTGGATVSIAVAANTGAARTGKVGIAGQTFTVEQLAASLNISGEITYGNTSTNQTAKFIPGADMNVSGSLSFSRKSDDSGNYLLTGLTGGGSFVVTPSKSPDVGSITNFDASLVARQSANLISLTPNQLIAADVSGNGTVTSFDASLIARTATGTANNGAAGQWKFISSSKNYQALTANQTAQNFEAILMGDVSGNWVRPGGLPQQTASEAERAEADLLEERAFEENRKLQALSVEAEAATAETATAENTSPADANGDEFAEKQLAPVAGIAVSLPVGASALKDTTVLIPVSVEDVTNQGVFGYDFAVSFDSAVLQPAAVAFDTTGTMSGAAGFSVTPNAGVAGRLIVGGSGTQPLAGSGTLIYLRFNVIGTAGSATTGTTNLSFNRFVFNEGDPSTQTANGSFAVATLPTAAFTQISGRVTTESGRGVRNARISMIDARGNMRIAVTSGFGNYRFDNVLAGETYVFSVKARRYHFEQPVEIKAVGEAINNLNFTAKPF